VGETGLCDPDLAVLAFVIRRAIHGVDLTTRRTPSARGSLANARRILRLAEQETRIDLGGRSVSSKALPARLTICRLTDDMVQRIKTAFRQSWIPKPAPVTGWRRSKRRSSSVPDVRRAAEENRRCGRIACTGDGNMDRCIEVFRLHAREAAARGENGDLAQSCSS